MNQLRAAFLDPAVRTLYGDQWESLAHNTIAGVRALLGPEVDDPLLNELVGELSVRSDHFRTLWARHDIRARISGGTRHMHHPQAGELDLHYENLQIAGTDGQTLVIYHADPGSPTAQALGLLSTLTADSSKGIAPAAESASARERNRAATSSREMAPAPARLADAPTSSTLTTVSVNGSRSPRRATSNHSSGPVGQSKRGSEISAAAASKAILNGASPTGSSTESPSDPLVAIATQTSSPTADTKSRTSTRSARRIGTSRSRWAKAASSAVGSTKRAAARSLALGDVTEPIVVVGQPGARHRGAQPTPRRRRHAPGLPLRAGE